MKNWLASMDNSRLFRYLLLFALGWAIAQVFAYLASVWIVFISAAILAFLLNYPVTWLKRFISHGAAVSIVFFLSLLILGGLAFTLGLAMISQAQQLISDAPQQIPVFIAWLGQLESLLRRWNLQLNLSAIEEQFRNQVVAGLEFGLVTIQLLFTSLLDIVLIAVVTFFMLLDGKRPWQFCLKLFPESIQHRLPLAIRQNFLGFFWGRFLLSVFFGVSVFIVLVILQVPYALVLAAIAGVFDLIPGIGATLGISLVSLIILPQGWWFSLKVLVSCILLQQVEENILMPRVMRGSVNLNPVVLFLSLLVGLKVAGMFGVFLAIPVTGTIISILNIKELQG